MPQQKFKTVLFICTVNHYRSRFSECFFNALAKERGLPWRATSRGFKTWMWDGHEPISEFTAYRLIAMGIPFARDRFPIQLSETDLENADLVVAVKDGEHRAMMEEQFPTWADRIEYWHVDDQDCAPPRETLAHCQFCVEELVERLAAKKEKTKRRRRLEHAA
jgi:protein-tyrosine phosphatase